MRPVHVAVTASSDGYTLRLTPIHPFDSSLGHHMAPLCSLDEQSISHFVFDFARLQDIADSGLAWLILFASRAAGENRSVSLANCSQQIVQRCLAAGFEFGERCSLLEYCAAAAKPRPTPLRLNPGAGRYAMRSAGAAS